MSTALGFSLGQTYQRVFTAPVALSEAWAIVSPHHKGAGQPGDVRRGIHVVDGAMTILPRAFYFSDTVVSRTEDISRLRITVSEESATIVLKMGDARRPYAHLQAHQAVLQQPRVPLEGVGPTHEFKASEGQLFYVTPEQTLPIGPYEPGPMELSIAQGSGLAGRIVSVEAWDGAGESLVSEDHAGAAVNKQIPLIGALCGGLIGLCAMSTLGRRRDPLTILRTALFSALPALILLVPAGEWLTWTERFYLSETEPWVVSRLALAALLIPAVCAGLVSSGLLSLSGTRLIQTTRKVRPWFVCWGVFALAALAQGGRLQEGLGLLWLLPMALFLGLPVWLMRGVGLRSARWLVMDLPSLVALTFLGWGHGLILATVWRLVLSLSSTPVFLARGPRPATLHLLLLVLILPVAIETSIRSTYLSTVWDAAELGLHDSKDRGWKKAVVTWSGTCGPDDAATQKRLIFAGGSSTGSFNSYKRTHIQYFPELIHTQLCQGLPADHRLETVNYGGGDRNTFTISRTMDKMVHDGVPDLFVLYGGVNDLFSRRHPKTRKQRHLEQESQGVAARGLRGLSTRLRLVSGLSLPFRTLGLGDGQVSEVPLEDATENHQLIMDGLAGNALLLMTERVRARQTHELAPYERMQADLAAGHTSVHHLSLSELLPQERVETLLADSPHYTPEGHAAFAAAVLPEVRRLLGAETPAD